MKYVILDLEWNQGNEQRESQLKEIPFEIIEIGAIMLDSHMEICSRFHERIRPQVYKEMHYMTQRLLHISMDELMECRPFPEVINDFLTWCLNGREWLCGRDVMFGSWGPQDLTELQRNMRYYNIEPISTKPIKFYDVQKLFSLAYEDSKLRRNLEYAADYLNIVKDEPFHRALSDAYYAARILQQMKDPMIMQRVSFDCFSVPLNRREEVHIVFDNYAKYISRKMDNKSQLLADKEIISTKCYLCHRNLKKKIRWFTPNGKHYYSVSFCEKHGFMKGKIRIRKTEDEKVYAVKTSKFISEKEAGEIFDRKDRAREIRRMKRHKDEEE